MLLSIVLPKQTNDFSGTSWDPSEFYINRSYLDSRIYLEIVLSSMSGCNISLFSLVVYPYEKLPDIIVSQKMAAAFCNFT